MGSLCLSVLSASAGTIFRWSASNESGGAVPRAYAQAASTGGSYISDIRIDPNLTPGKNFTIAADVSVLQSNVGGNNRIQVAISVPAQLSISPSVIYDLGTTSGGSTKTVQWIASASTSGSFPITFTVYSIDTSTGVQTSNSLTITVSVGSIKSVSITELNIPGNLIPNSNFIVSAKIRNSGLGPAENIIAQITVPLGLQVIGNVTQNLPSVKPGADTLVQWHLTALTAGSNSISIVFSSTNGGSDSITGTVTVGNNLVADVSSDSIYLGDNKTSQIQLRPGDTDVPLHVVLANTGNLPVYNIDAALKLIEPFYSKSGQVTATAVLRSSKIARLDVGQTTDAVFFLSVRPDATVGPYNLNMNTTFTDKINVYSKDISLPIVISPSSIVSITTSASALKAGVVSPVDIVVTNTGDLAVHDLLITPQSSTQFTPVYSPIYVGTLSVDETKKVEMQIYTSAQATDVSLLSLGISYTAGGNTVHQTQQIGLTFSGSPAFTLKSVTLVPSVSYAGDTTVKMDVDVTNSGYVIANDVSSTLAIPAGFTPSWGNSTSSYLGKILPGSDSVASFVFDISANTASRAYPFTVNLKYLGGTAQLPVNFVVSPKAAFEVLSLDDSALYPGASNVPIKVSIKNVGDATADSVTAKFLGGNTVSGVKNSDVVTVGDVVNPGNVATGQQIEAVFMVDVDQYVNKGTQLSTLEFSWNQNNKTFVQDINLPYSVAPGPNYLLYYGGIPFLYVAIVAALAILAAIFFTIRRKRNRAILASIEESEPAALREQNRLSHKADLIKREEDESGR